MHKRQYLILGRFGFGLLALSAVVFQLSEGLMRPSFSVWNFFSFFTIQSNIFAATLFVFMAILMSRGHTVSWYKLRGAATLYMAMTGIIYMLLLAGLEESLQTPTPWVNAVLHYIMPLAVVADWLYDTPHARLTFRQALPWLAFPLAYVIYTLLRGLAVDWYPYPFLNPAEHGYLGVFAASVIILPTVLAFVSCLAWSTRRKPARK